MEISARNQIRGVVTGVYAGNTMGEVEVAIDPSTVTAVITMASIQRLGLKNGDRVIVIVNSTEVMIGKE